EGPRALGRFLAAIGVAQLRAGPPGDAPPEDLWLGDPAVVQACAALLEGLLHEPEFLRRCAKAELSRDDERAIAIAGVFDARLAFAQRPVGTGRTTDRGRPVGGDGQPGRNRRSGGRAHRVLPVSHTGRRVTD